MDGNVDIGPELVPLENYIVSQSSIGMCGEHGRVNELYGRYAGCLGVDSYNQLMDQIDATSEEREKFTSLEHRLLLEA